MTTKTHGYPAVEVIWEDAESDSAWYSAPEEANLDSPRLCRTRGFLIASTKQRIVIAHTVSTANAKTGEVHYNGHITIPRGMIRKITISKKLYG